MQKETYQIGEIAITEDGSWYVYWYGNHAEQGGISFTKGNLGSDDIQGLLKIVSKDLEKCKDIFLEQIQKNKGKES